MNLDELDIDWDYLIERLEQLINLGEEALGRKLSIYQPDPEQFRTHQAFRWLADEEGGLFAPIPEPHPPELRDLIGLDAIIDQMVRNTRQFVAGYPANNVLLWGERGSGKSSAVKGLLHEFSDSPLRMIEVRKTDLFNLPDITFYLRGLPYRFILFCDDLGFNDVDDDFREFKSLLEGCLDAKPDNILIYATSNRRHLIPEPIAENTNIAEIHPQEMHSEKLSLSERFGLSFGFYPMDEEVYLEIVRHHASKRQLKISDRQLMQQARKWAQWRGARSGRVVQQFLDDLTGRLALTRETPSRNKP